MKIRNSRGDPVGRSRKGRREHVAQNKYIRHPAVFGNSPLEEHSIFIETCGAILHFFLGPGNLVEGIFSKQHIEE